MVLRFTAREAMLEKLNVVACILVRPEADYPLNLQVCKDSTLTMAKAINRKITIEFRVRFGWLAARKTQEAPENSLGPNRWLG